MRRHPSRALNGGPADVNGSDAYVGNAGQRRPTKKQILEARMKEINDRLALNSNQFAKQKSSLSQSSLQTLAPIPKYAGTSRPNSRGSSTKNNFRHMGAPSDASGTTLGRHHGIGGRGNPRRRRVVSDPRQEEDWANSIFTELPSLRCHFQEACKESRSPTMARTGRLAMDRFPDRSCSMPASSRGGPSYNLFEYFPEPMEFPEQLSKSSPVGSLSSSPRKPSKRIFEESHGSRNPSKARGGTMFLPALPAAEIGSSPATARDHEAESRSASKLLRLDSDESVDVPEVRKKSKAPAEVADLAHKWHYPLATVKEAAAYFRKHATLPGLEEDEDILRDGTLSKEEMIVLVEGLSCIAGPEDDDRAAMADMIMGHIDRNGDGSVDFHEFAEWYHDRGFEEYMNLDKREIELRRAGEKLGLNVAEMEHYKKEFERFDTDGSGEIELDEFRELLNVLLKVPANGEKIPESRVQSFWRICDLDGNGSLDLVEFVTFWLKHFEPGGSNPLEDFYQGTRAVSVSKPFFDNE